MRPWITVAASVAAAIAAAAALVRPEMALTSRSALVASLAPLIPTFAVAALAVYGLCAIWLSAIGVIAELGGLRRRLDAEIADPSAARPTRGRFVSANLERLLPLPPDARRASGPRLGPGELRREIAQLYYLAAARAQVFSAMIVLAAIVVLGAAQQRGALPVVAAVIPAGAAALAVVGLVLLALLARIAVDVAGEPLIEAVTRNAPAPSEAALLERAVARIENAASAREAPAAAAAQAWDRAAAAIERAQQALTQSADRLAQTSDGVTAAAAAIAGAIAAAEARDAGGVLRPGGGNEDSGEAIAAMTQLREAIVRLTQLLEQPRSAAADAEAAATADAARREPPPDLAAELRRLLQEIDTAP